MYVMQRAKLASLSHSDTLDEEDFLNVGEVIYVRSFWKTSFHILLGSSYSSLLVRKKENVSELVDFYCSDVALWLIIVLSPQIQ
jgi:hypothetical protein